jgi:dienelactone hydrolase
MKKTILSWYIVTFFPIVIPFVFNINSYGQAETEDLSILKDWIEWSDGKNMLVHHLNRQAFSYLDERDREIAELKTSEDWTARQKKVKEVLMKLVGPFPGKTPLNARITGIVKKDGYRIEKVIYESIPDFLVTACLFIPDGIKAKEKRPVIIQVSGHGFQAFRSPGTIRQILNLVSRGFIVFAIDPVGQGERVQYWDNEKKASRLGTSPVSEHSYFGNQMFLSGISPIRYFTWDGIRGVDYLISRKEVDPDRIGIFGCSGGGTQTTFIAALDDRIKAAAPGCYITGYRRLLESIGPQDAEQNIYQGIKYGITHADLLELRAPKPLLISSTTRDYFSIQGAMESFAEVKMAYKAFGKEENAGQVIDDSGHGFARNINAIYSFFETTLDRPGGAKEVKYEALKPDELQVTPTGQIVTSYGGETAFTIGLRTAKALVSKLMESRKNPGTHLSSVTIGAKELSGYIAPRPETKYVFRGRYQRKGYAVEMYALQGEGNYVIPLLLFVPANVARCPSVIYIHPKGKSTDAAAGGRIEQLTRGGFIVAAPDLIGTGEVAPDSRDGTDYIPNYVALLTGRSIPGIQAGDIIRVVNFLKMRNDVDINNIGSIAFDEMCPALLHAAAFDRSINPVILSGPPVSYRSIATNRDYEVRLSEEVVQAANASNEVNYSNSTVAGALTGYDLPDLIGCIAPGKIALIDIKDQMKKTAPEEVINEELQFPRSVYLLKKAPGNIRILPLPDDILPVIKWGFE